MKKRIMSVMAILMMVASMVGCGVYTEVAALEPEGESVVEEKEEVTIRIETKSEENQETEEVTEETEEVEAESYEDMGLFYGEKYKDIKNRIIDTDDEEVFKKCSETYKLTESIEIYWSDGTVAGYTKPNIKATIHSKGEGWYLLLLDKYSRLVKAEDFDKVATLISYYDEERECYVNVAEEAKKESESKVENSNIMEESPELTVKEEVENIPETQPSETEPVETGKYTPEEAVEVYRSIMESNGMVWNPGLKGVSSWGTGWIYLEKGQPEWTANTNIESCKMGDSVGNPYTQYYFEVTGSDNNAVYITEWHN